MTDTQRPSDSQGIEVVQCEWFALCDNAATTTEPHPVLGDVLICARCATIVRDLGGRS